MIPHICRILLVPSSHRFHLRSRRGDYRKASAPVGDVLESDLRILPTRPLQSAAKVIILGLKLNKLKLLRNIYKWFFIDLNIKSKLCNMKRYFYIHLLHFFNFIFTLFDFTILYWFCHTLTWIRHGCIRARNPDPPSQLPPHPHIISLWSLFLSTPSTSNLCACWSPCVGVYKS